jgi:hypothetical protein
LRNKIVYGLALFSILLFFSTTINTATATSYTVGVTAGTSADYSVKQTGTTATGTIHINVTSVSTPKITYKESGSWANGTTITEFTVTGDVSDGSSLLWFIGADLAAHDPVYTSALASINETVTMTVGGASRSVNHINLTIGSGSIVYVIINAYWDKPTGLLAQIMLYYTTIGWTNMTLSSTTAWGGGGGLGGEGTILGMSVTGLAAVGGALVIIIVIAVIVLRRRK